MNMYQKRKVRQEKRENNSEEKIVKLPQFRGKVRII